MLGIIMKLDYANIVTTIISHYMKKILLKKKGKKYKKI